MIAPDGTPGDIPYERMKDAQAAGFKPAVMMQSQDGKIGYIPADRTADASKAGLKLLPMGQQEAKDHPGFWSEVGAAAAASVGIDMSSDDIRDMGSALKEDLPKLGLAIAESPVTMSPPVMAYRQVKKGIQDIRTKLSGGKTPEEIHAEQEAAAGHGAVYQGLARGAESLGVNVQGMEDAAEKGSPGGVIGHAAAVPLTMAATELAGAAVPKVVEGASATADAAGRVADLTHEVTPKQVAQVAGVTHFTGKAVGKIVEAILGKERANSPISARDVPFNAGANLPATPPAEVLRANPLSTGAQSAEISPAQAQALSDIRQRGVYPGAPQPTMPPQVAQASGLGSIPQRVAPPAAQTGEALGTIPARAVPGEVAPTAEAAPAEPPPAPSPTTEPKPPSEVTLTGESALRKILTGQDNANLLKIAKSRGINVTQESQLKPGVADGKLINKIIDSHSEEELSNLRDLYMENTRFKHDFGDIGPEAWKALSMQSYFPDVKIPATVLKRMESSVRAASAAKTAAPPSDLTPLLQQSLENVKRRREASQ